MFWLAAFSAAWAAMLPDNALLMMLIGQFSFVKSVARADGQAVNRCYLVQATFQTALLSGAAILSVLTVLLAETGALAAGSNWRRMASAMPKARWPAILSATRLSAISSMSLLMGSLKTLSSPAISRVPERIWRSMCEMKNASNLTAASVALAA